MIYDMVELLVSVSVSETFIFLGGYGGITSGGFPISFSEKNLKEIFFSQVEFRAVQQRIHDLNQEMEVRIRQLSEIAMIARTISMCNISTGEN